MQQFKDREDFREAVMRLDCVHSRYKDDTNFLMLFKKFDLNRKDLTLILRVYNGHMMWMCQIDRACIDNMRAKSEVQGSYYSFCELVKNAIDNQMYDLMEYGQELTLVLYFKVSRDVQLKGLLELNHGVPITNDEDTRKLQMDFTYDLYEALRSNQIVYTKEVEVFRKKKPTPALIDIDAVPEKKAPPPPPRKNLLLMGVDALEGEVPPEKKDKVQMPPFHKKR